jgi:hypothetical protein
MRQSVCPGELMANVDLRPMTLGEVLDRTFTLYRENFLLFVGIASLPYLVLLIFNFGTLLLGRGTVYGKAPTLASPGMLGGFIVGMFGALFLFLLMIGVTHAATVSAVSELYLGRSTSVLNSYNQAKGSILSVVAVIVLGFLGVGVAAIFLIIPGIYLFCRLAVSVPAAIIEKDSPFAAMERSMDLTRGYAGQMFLLLLLVWVLGMVVGGVLQLPGTILMFMAVAAKHQPSVAVMAYNYVAQFVSQVLVGPIGTISASLMYYNLRVQKEGFDIQHLMNSLGSMPRPLADAPSAQ